MSTKLFFWNVRGINDPDKHLPFSQWLSSYRPVFGALLETHIKEQNLPVVMSKLCPGWNFASNHNSDEDGRIVIIWSHTISVRLLSQTKQSLTCELTTSPSQKILFTAVYACNTVAERSDLWVDLLNLQQSLSTDDLPWTVGGDFNQILHHSEHSSPHIASLTPPMIDFADCLTQAGLFDLRFHGELNTWTNKTPTAPIAKKLDRLLVNQSWISLLPHSSATFLSPNFSDHSPCVLDLDVPLPISGTKPFKFFNYLTKHPKFLAIVMDFWTQTGGTALTLGELCWNLKQIKRVLKKINRENFSKIQERVAIANSLLKIVQGQALQDPTPALFQKERELMAKWEFLRTIEEAYFRQKSRINWLREGDLNTSYFHRIWKVRTAVNSIRSFMLSNGVLIFDPVQMGYLAINHFKSILAPDVTPPTISSIAWFQSLLSFRCSADHCTWLSILPSTDTITTTLFKLNPNKAPGPDGLTSGFFKASWSVLGPEVTASITAFFTTGFLPATVNSTILSLVPKHPGASSVADYRPISCCTTLYKTISKILVAKLKPILSDLILPNQTAFIQGRLLVENTILATDLVDGYHKNKGPPRITLKVDIAKAFDTLNWDFLFICLSALEVPSIYLNWLRACVCTPSFTIGYNGTIQGHFKGKRGLRQGDPLSPYLFVIAMNCLSHLLNKGAAEGRFGYHAKCHSSKLTHLCFADDLLIFTDGSLASVQAILQILHDFSLHSGLAVSVQKTSFVSSGLTQDQVDAIASTTGLTSGSLPVRYLGVPLTSQKLSLQLCSPLLQHIKGKINSWSSRALSFAGRLVMLNTVIAGITNFWSSTFVLPKACIKKINSLCSTFLWHGSTEGTHSARVAWDTVTLSKEEGGLGCRDLVAWNTACSIKLIWLLFTNAGSIWVAWFVQEILKGDVANYWITTPKQRYAWFTNRLLKLKHIAYEWIKIQVGSGTSVRFWTDNWSPFGSLSDFLAPQRHNSMGVPLNSLLRDLYSDGSWSIRPSRSERQVQLQVYLSSLQLSDLPDKTVWVVNGSEWKKYNTGAIYKLLKQHGNLVPWKSVVWNRGGIPKHSFLTWLITLDRLPTKDRLLSWGLQVSPQCLLCASPLLVESRDHLFFECSFAFGLWDIFARRLGIAPSHSWASTLSDMQALGGSCWQKKLTLIVWQLTLYSLWLERNSRLHNQVLKSYSQIASTMDRTIRNRIQCFRETNPAVCSLMMQFWMQSAN